jgi:hypothetical protein
LTESEKPRGGRRWIPSLEVQRAFDRTRNGFNSDLVMDFNS